MRPYTRSSWPGRTRTCSKSGGTRGSLLLKKHGGKIGGAYQGRFFIQHHDLQLLPPAGGGNNRRRRDYKVSPSYKPPLESLTHPLSLSYWGSTATRRKAAMSSATGAPSASA